MTEAEKAELNRVAEMFNLVMRKFDLTPTCLALMYRWAQTGEGEKFKAGGKLEPLDNGKRTKFNYVRRDVEPVERRPRKFKRKKRMDDYDFDWGFDEG